MQNNSGIRSKYYPPAGTIDCLEGTLYTSEPALDDELGVYEFIEDEAARLNLWCLWPDEEYVTYYLLVHFADEM